LNKRDLGFGTATEATDSSCYRKSDRASLTRPLLRPYLAPEGQLCHPTRHRALSRRLPSRSRCVKEALLHLSVRSGDSRPDADPAPITALILPAAGLRAGDFTGATEVPAEAGRGPGVSRSAAERSPQLARLS